MRFLIALLFAMLPVAVSAPAARAESAHTCVYVETLAGLPADLNRLRFQDGSSREFQRTLMSLQSRLWSDRHLVIFTTAELFVMKSFLESIDQHWRQFGQNGTLVVTPEVLGISESTQQAIAQIMTKFSCDDPTAQDVAPLKGFESQPVTVVFVLVSILALLAVIFAVMKFTRYGQRDTRVICRVPANLAVDSEKFATQIVNISCGGVMVAAPDADIENATVTLCLPAANIKSRVVWTNSNFAGLAFEKKISMNKVEEIAFSKHLPSEIGSPAKDFGRPAEAVSIK